MTKKNTKREDILYAAAKIITSESVSKFTLENVAKKAKVSKGGLLYHFPNKESIIQGMLEVPMEHYHSSILNYIEKDSNGNGKWCRAYARESFMIPEDMKLLWMAGLISALSINPKLLEPLRKRFKTWQKNIENDGIDPIKATNIRLIADGLWFLDLFDIPIINEEMKENIIDSILDDTRDS